MTAFAVKTEFVFLVNWWIPEFGSGYFTVSAPSKEDAERYVIMTFDCKILDIRLIENFVLEEI